MTKLILIRHGQTEWNLKGRYQGQSDIALSEKGREQAKQLAAHFPVQSVDAFYASDLTRAMDTAAAVATSFDKEVQPIKELREIHFGKWEGLTYPEICAGWPDESKNFFSNPEHADIPDGETFTEVQNRGVQAVLKIVSLHPEQTVAITAHGGILRTILAEALHMPMQYMWTMRQDNTAVNIIHYDENYRMIELLNSTAHLHKMK